MTSGSSPQPIGQAAVHPLAPLSVAAGISLYSVGPLLAKLADDLDGLEFVFVRLMLGLPVAAVFLVASRVSGAARPRFDRAGRRGRIMTVVAAGGALGLQQYCVMSAVKRLPVTDVVIIGVLSPILIWAVVYVMSRRFPAGKELVAFFLGACGVLVVVLTGRAGSVALSGEGLILAFGNVFAFSAFVMLSAEARRRGVKALTLVGSAGLVAACIISVVALLADSVPYEVRTRDLLLAGAVALGPGGLGHVFVSWPLRWLSASTAALARLAQPPLAALFAWWWLGEALTASQVVGGALAIVGVSMILRRPPRRTMNVNDRDVV